jgi:hypothetical protein
VQLCCTNTPKSAALLVHELSEKTTKIIVDWLTIKKESFSSGPRDYTKRGTIQKERMRMLIIAMDHHILYNDIVLPTWPIMGKAFFTG